MTPRRSGGPYVDVRWHRGGATSRMIRRDSHHRVTGSLTPWVRDDLPSATVAVCPRRDVPPSRARPPRAEARTASHNPRLAKSPSGVREGVHKRRSGLCAAADRGIFAPRCRTFLGYESGVRLTSPCPRGGRSVRRAVPRAHAEESRHCAHRTGGELPALNLVERPLQSTRYFPFRRRAC